MFGSDAYACLTYIRVSCTSVRGAHVLGVYTCVTFIRARGKPVLDEHALDAGTIVQLVQPQDLYMYATYQRDIQVNCTCFPTPTVT